MRLNLSSPAEIRVFPQAADLMRAAADEFLRAAGQAVAERGCFTVALSGGSTPKGIYAVLAGDEARKRATIPWSAMQFFFSDERAVPPDHPDSNFRMAFEALLSRVPVPRQNIHRVLAERPVRAAAELYETEVRRTFDGPADQVPRFDLIMLGLGADGHTASLFPGTKALEETHRLVSANRVAQPGAERITFTLPLINAAAEVMFVVSGPDKAEKVREVLADIRPDGPCPAQRVRPAKGRLLWLLDEAAGARCAPPA
jgi:6-phosphogluconolactonase